MAVYKYTAMDSGGKEKKGKIEAESEQSAIAALKEKNLFITLIKKTGRDSKKGNVDNTAKKSSLNINIGTPKIPTKDLTLFTRQLAILLDAGLPLIRALRTLERQAKNKIVKRIIAETADNVEGGFTFSESLAKNPKSFDFLYVNMVRAGESAGALEIILNRLASFMEKTAKIVGKVKSAMIYPIVVITVAVLVTAMLMIFIVPKFKKIFDDLLSGMPLPKLTQFVIGMSDFLMNRIYYIIIGIIVIIVVYKVLKKTKAGLHWIDFVKYRMPLFGPIIAKSSISRFARTLGTLMASGVPVLNGLLIVRDTASNSLVKNAVQKVHDAVKEGEGISGPLGASNIFPDMVVSMIEVGEETGKLPEMLVKIADTYDDEVDNAVDGLTSMIEPLMIVGMAVVVGTIVIGMFLPLIKIMESLG
jgi:type IV pilus assembly protein PilC